MRFLASCFLMASLTACDEPVKPTPFVPVQVAGTYALQTIDGAPLPWTLAQGAAHRTEYIAGELVMRENLSFTMAVHERVTYTGGDSIQSRTLTHAGTYTKNDTTGAVALTFAFTTSAGQVDGKALTLTFLGDAWGYLRP